MLLFSQNTSTSITIGPVVTSAGVISSGMTTAASIVYQNGGLATTLSLTSVVYKTGGLYQIDLSSNATANVGRIIIHVVSNVGYNGGGPIYGGVLLAANYTLLYGSSAIATVLSSLAWQETSRLLTSGAVVWSASSRDLSTYAALSSAIWTFTSRSLTSNLTSWAASDVWAVASRTLTSWGGISTAAPSTLAAADVWGYSTRNLTSGASTFTAADVWAVAARTLTSALVMWTETSRTLTSWGGIPTASTWGASDVWGYSARTLTSADAVWSATSKTLTSWGGIPTASTWGASDVWGYSARTLTSANVIWAETSRLLTSYAALMNTPIDGSLTFIQKQRLETGVLLSDSTGGGTAAIAFRNWGSTKDRVSYAVTTVGNRTLTTYDLT